MILQDVTTYSLPYGANVSEKPIAYILHLKWRKQKIETFFYSRENF